VFVVSSFTFVVDFIMGSQLSCLVCVVKVLYKLLLIMFHMLQISQINCKTLLINKKRSVCEQGIW